MTNAGMTILAAEGLDLKVMQASFTAELVEWHSTAAGKRPDADLTVLMWLRYGDGTAEWYSGYWDGGQWVDVTGMPVHDTATVTHWAEPEGPAA